MLWAMYKLILTATLTGGAAIVAFIIAGVNMPKSQYDLGNVAASSTAFALGTGLGTLAIIALLLAFHAEAVGDQFRDALKKDRDNAARESKAAERRA